MAQECEEAYVGIGSCGQEQTRSNPLNFEVRKAALRNVFSNRFKVFPLSDLGATETTNEWVDYVLAKVKKVGMKDPTDYYAGSVADALWYKERFFHKDLSTLPTRRQYSEYAASEPYYWNYSHPYDRALGKFDEVERRLHILDRDANNFPPATELRAYIELGSDEWKQWVPRVNHQLILTNYPNEFKVGVRS